MNEWVTFINLYLVPGLTIGSVYGLGAVGISMIFGILRFAHFAHGDLMTVGGYGTLTAVWLLPLHPLLLMPFGIVLAIVSALAVDRLFYRPLRDLPTIYTVIASFGVALIFRALVQLFWSSGNQGFIPGIRPPLVLFDTFRIVTLHAQVILLTALIALALHLFLSRSQMGRSMRAVSDEPELAAVAGLDTERVIRDNEVSARAAGKDVERFRRQAFAIGAAIMGIAGGLSAHYFKFLSPSATEPLLVTFLVWVMLMAGGSGNNRGAILGGLAIWFLWSATEISSNRLPPDWITRASARMRARPAGWSRRFRRTTCCTPRTASALRASPTSTACHRRGAVLIAAPLKIERGTGSPIRALALVPRASPS